MSVVVLLVVLVLGGGYLWTVRVEVAVAVASIGVAPVVGALLLTVLGVLATGQSWLVWLRCLAEAPPLRTSHQVFYLTQSGKYLPGSLWPFLAQAVLARRFGVPRSAMLTATTLFLLTHVVTGTAVGLVAVGPAGTTGWTWALYPAAAVALLGLCPPVLARGVALADRLRGRAGAMAASPTWGAVARAVLLMLLAWAAYGTATWLLVRPLSDGGPSLAVSVGAYALAWVVGFLAVAAPAGVGVREAVLVLVLAPLLETPEALSVALLSRVVLTLADLGLALGSSGVLGEGPAVTAGSSPSAGPGG